MQTRISVVVPAFNEERYLPRLLDSIDAARLRHPAGPAAVEVIVADNGSTDATARIAAARGCRTVAVRPRRIGAVRNAGARAARGRILAFVDADMQVHPGTFRAIEAHFARGRDGAAITGALPERRSAGIDTAWWLLGACTVLAGYGMPLTFHECMPSGVVCCRREDWAAVGGYCEKRLFAEDLRFLLDLQDLARRRGERAGWIAGVPAVCSTRKFDAHGDWHYLEMAAMLPLWAFFDRGALRRFARRYWYGAQRH